MAGEYVKVFRDHPLTEVAGIYNRTPGKAARLLQTHGVEGTEYPTLDDFFADERIQIVVSCTHPDVRADHRIRAHEYWSFPTIYDSYKSMAICFAIDESVAKGGQPVEVSRD